MFRTVSKWNGPCFKAFCLGNRSCRFRPLPRPRPGRRALRPAAGGCPPPAWLPLNFAAGRPPRAAPRGLRGACACPAPGALPPAVRAAARRFGACGFGVWAAGCASRLGAWGLPAPPCAFGLGVWALRLRAWGSGFAPSGLGLGVCAFAFWVCGSSGAGVGVRGPGERGGLSGSRARNLKRQRNPGISFFFEEFGRDDRGLFVPQIRQI